MQTVLLLRKMQFNFLLQRRACGLLWQLACTISVTSVIVFLQGYWLLWFTLAKTSLDAPNL